MSSGCPRNPCFYPPFEYLIQKDGQLTMLAKLSDDDATNEHSLIDGAKVTVDTTYDIPGPTR